MVKMLLLLVPMTAFPSALKTLGLLMIMAALDVTGELKVEVAWIDSV